MNKTSLTALVDEHIRRAGDNQSDGRSAHTVYGGQGKVLRHSLETLEASAVLLTVGRHH